MANKDSVWVCIHIHAEQKAESSFLQGFWPAKKKTLILDFWVAGHIFTWDGSSETPVFRKQDMWGHVKIKKYLDEKKYLFIVSPVKSNTYSLKKVCHILHSKGVKILINKNHA